MYDSSVIFFKGNKAQAFKSEKIYIPTGVPVWIFSVSLSFYFSFTSKYYIFRKCNCPVSTHSLPLVTS